MLFQLAGSLARRVLPTTFALGGRLLPGLVPVSGVGPRMRLHASSLLSRGRPLIGPRAPGSVGLGVRWTTYGQEYQPSSRRRKRKFGYLARLRSRTGRRILKRRIMKGRKYLAC